MVRDELKNYSAREIEWAGDSCLAVFSKPSDAAAFALRLQALHRLEREKDQVFPRVRIGLHVGEIVVRQREDGSDREDLFGLQVSEAARVMSLARPDQIYCTRAVFDNARSALKGRQIENIGTVEWRNYGLFDLKGSDEPAEICEIGESGFAPLLPPIANDKCRPIRGDIERWRKRRARAGSSRTGVPGWAVIIAVGVALAIGIAIGRELLLNEPPDRGTSRGYDSAPAHRVVRFNVAVPDQSKLRPGTLPRLSIAPDGSRLAFATDPWRRTLSPIYVRPLDSFDDKTMAVPNSEGAVEVAFSPDNQSLVYFKNRNLRKHNLVTGATADIFPANVDAPHQISWGLDGTLLLGSYNGLYIGEVQGTDLRQLTRTDETNAERGHQYPWIIPGRREALFSSLAETESESEICLVNLDSGKIDVLFTGGVAPRYTTTGHLLYASSGKIWALPYDIDHRLSQGEPRVVIEDAAFAITTSKFAVSDDGTLVYLAYSNSAPQMNYGSRDLVWINEDGSLDPVRLPPASYVFPTISVDGMRIACSVGARGVGRLWVYNLEAGNGYYLTTKSGSGEMPTWSRKGNWIAFRTEDGIFRIQPRAAAEPELILPSDRSLLPSSWTPDETEIIFTDVEDFTIKAVKMDGTVRTLVKRPGESAAGQVSPDGRWLAYTNADSGQNEIWVQTFSEATPRDPVLISTEGGRGPVWARDGSALYYATNEHSAIMRVAEDAENGKWSRPELYRTLDPMLFAPSQFVSSYDIAPDGRILSVKEEANQNVLEIRVVLNWFEELKQIAPAATTN